MNLVLHPRAAPPDRLRFWIGAFQTNTAPALRWFLDGVETVPLEQRALQSVRPVALVPAGEDRVFAGVYEFTGLAENTPHDIRVEGGGASATFQARTLPQSVPATFDGTFNVLLVSCFHQLEDRKGIAGTIVSQLPPSLKPHLSLLMGDQVYLDLPTLKNFKKQDTWLAKKFEDDYVRNWQGAPGYAQILDAAPSASLPDDHEFWNNYPHTSPMIENSWTQDGREHWHRAASTVYEGFQQPFPCALDEPATIDVDPLSFFLPDMRSLRDSNRAYLLTEPAHARLAQWIDRVIAQKKFGVFVSGQSLFTKAVGDFTGSVADYELPNYGDYGRVMKQLERLTDAGLPALCLTGDVHWGRLTMSTDIRTQRTAFYEVIASPSSLVTTVGSDTVKEIGAWFGGLFGKKNPWPRHADPDPPPDFLASGALNGRFRNHKLHGQRGNHVALLRFSQQGGGLSFRVTYWPLSRDSAAGQPVELGPYSLRTN